MITDSDMRPIFQESPAPFWMVWSESGGAPTVKHKTEADALRECYRLATKHHARKFFVLQSIAHAEEVTVKTQMVLTRHGAKP